MSDSNDTLSKLWSVAFDRSLPDDEQLANLHALKAERESRGFGPISVTDSIATPGVGNIEAEIAKLEG